MLSESGSIKLLFPSPFRGGVGEGSVGWNRNRVAHRCAVEDMQTEKTHRVAVGYPEVATFWKIDLENGKY